MSHKEKVSNREMSRPGRFGRQVSVTDIYHTIPYQQLGWLELSIMMKLDSLVTRAK